MNELSQGECDYNILSFSFHMLQYKERDSENSVMYHKKCNEVDELRQEVIAFGEENAKLRLDLDIAINSARDLHDLSLIHI